MGERIDRMKMRAKTYYQGEQANKIKQHFEDNRVLYSCLAAAGITALIMRRSNIARGVMGGTDAQGGSSNTASLIFSNKQSIKITNVLDRDGGKGHPGWPVRNLETKRVFFSQKEAANVFAIPENLLSGHLNGKFPDVDGLHFERINLV